MYLQFFGLNEKPFAITPDPRYLFLSARHAEALAHLVYGINEAGGFIQLTGEVGTGKTTIIRSLLAQIPKGAEVALILNPRVSATEFLLTICEELGIGVPDESIHSSKDLVDILNDYLLRAHARGQRVVLVVDEAHNLDRDVLEQVRLLTNLETATQKLLQIILIGQPELRELLDRNDLRQLAQRVTGRYHLNPLMPDEAAAYVRHRLSVAGSKSDIFGPMALRELYRLSGGVPRLINIICDRALLGAYTKDMHRINGALVRKAAQEVFGKPFAPLWMPWAAGAATAAVLIFGGLALWKILGAGDAAPAPPVAAPAATDAPAAAAALPQRSGDALAPAAAAPQPDAPGTTRTAAGDTTAPAGGAAPVATSAAAAPGAAAPTDARSTAPTGAATPTAGASGAAPATLEQLLATYGNETDTDNAFNKLFALWNAHYVVGRTDACTQAAQQRLECYVQRGTLADLRLYNRPAILNLNDSAGRAHQIVLAGLDDDRAVISLAGSPRAVRIGELSRLWFGDFVLLWRPTLPNAKALSLGMRGPDVQRLRANLQKLRIAGGLPAVSAPGPKNVYDAELAQWVTEFQRSHRLNVDGVAGIQTLVVLDTALASPGSPLLDAGAPPPGSG